MKVKRDLNTKTNNFIKINAFVQSAKKTDFLYKIKNYRITILTDEIYINTNFIEYISSPVNDSVSLLIVTDDRPYDNYQTKKEIYFFRIKLYTGEEFYVNGNEFYKIKNIVDNE